MRIAPRTLRHTHPVMQVTLVQSSSPTTLPFCHSVSIPSSVNMPARLLINAWRIRALQHHKWPKAKNLRPHIEWWRADACTPPTPSKAHGSAVCAAPHNKASPASPARLNDGHCVCADSHAPLAGKKQRTGNQHPKGGVPSGGRSTLHMLPAQPTCATANRLPYQK